MKWRVVCVSGFHHSGVLHDEWDTALTERANLDQKRCGPHDILRSDGMTAPKNADRQEQP